MINLRNFLVALSVVCLNTLNVKADPINLQKAQTLAQPFMNNEFVKPVLVTKATRKSKAKLAPKYAASSPYYIFSRGKGLGFVVVSGDDCLPEILGYTENGDFEPDNLPPFLQWYLDYYATAVESAQAVNAPRFVEPKYATPRVDIAPLIKTHWHQDAPYNNFCPDRKDGGGKCVTGCVATAASQVAYYWWKDLPHETQSATSSYTYGDNAYATTAFPKGTPLMWELMQTQYNGSEPNEYRSAVATLLAVVGGGAHLTYGSSTSGYNDDCRAVYSNILGLNGGQENSKDWGEEYNNYSDAAWSTLLYNDLVQMHPVLYSGCNDKGEGHAVVVDGYRASSDLFHFNLGWGNPGTYDGYFTVARGQSPSWGFNNSWQECVTGVYPKKQNLTAAVELPIHSYMNRTNTLKVRVKNNGTLPYSGIYLFVTSTGARPTNISSAKDQNVDMVIPVDGSESEMKLSYKPNTSHNTYLTVTDKNLNVLVQEVIVAETPQSELSLVDMFVDGSSDVESFAGNDYTVVYGSKAMAQIEIKNFSSVPYEGTIRMNISASEDGGNTFAAVGTKTGRIEVASHSSGSVAITMSSTAGCPIEEGKLYVASFENPVKTNGITDEVVIPDGKKNEVRFLLKPGTLAVESFENDCLKFTGNWDVSLFTTAAKKVAYKSATSYDLTAVSGIGRIAESPVNPNAVFYVADDCDATGYNIINKGVCADLKLTPGYNFSVVSDFTATKASVVIMQQPNRWYLLTPPCELDVPVGMTARQIDNHSSTGISNKTTNISHLLAGRTYMVMTSSERNQTMTASDAHVSATLLSNPDSALVGTYTNVTTPEGAMLMDMEETQYFQPQEEGTAVEALRGYFLASNLKKAFRANSSVTLDPAYQTLGEAINCACEAKSEYADLVTDEANTMMEDSIACAESIFTMRETAVSGVRAAANRLVDFIEEYKSMMITLGDKEINCTGNIQNPSFEESTVTAKGWTVEGGTVKIYKDNNLWHRAVGMEGSNLVETTSGGESTVVSQLISGLVPGKYSLMSKVGSDEGNVIVMFAGADSVAVSAHPFGCYYLADARLDDVVVGTDGLLRIGVKSDSWFKADDFRLVLTEKTDVTEIEDIQNKSPETAVEGTFDLTGRRLDPSHVNATKGLLIVNGKKVLVK